MPSCPACGRGVALARASCLYCGAPLGAAAAPAPAAATLPTAREAAVFERTLVLVEPAVWPAETLADALGVSRYEAELLTRRGGLHLAGAAPQAQAEAEAERLRAWGVEPLLVPEAEARTPPVACLAGERQGDALRLRTPLGEARLSRGDALLVVRGVIVRQRQDSPERRRIATARLEDGFRVHVHRRSDPRPLEIDALGFELGFAASGSVRLELDAWLEAVAGDTPRDEGFARVPPALGPAQPEPAGALGAVAALGAPGAGAAGARAVVLDNLAQFRFYSGCAGAVARRRAARGAQG